MNIGLHGRGQDLTVVAIMSSSDAIEIMSRTLSQSGDRLSVATDLAEGLVQISSQVPDVAFVDVTLGDGAGLAVLHHIRALAPHVSVFALTRSDRLPLGVQASSLGSAGTLVMPLSGDEVLNALSARCRGAAGRAARASHWLAVCGGVRAGGGGLAPAHARRQSRKCPGFADFLR